MNQNFSHRINNEEVIVQVRNLMYKNLYLTDIKNRLPKSLKGNKSGELPIKISLKSEDVEKIFELTKIPIKTKDIVKFSTKNRQPFDIDLIYFDDEMILNLIINFESVKSTEDLISYSKLYNELLTGKAYLNGKALTFKKDAQSLLVGNETLDYFNDITEIENWLNLSFFDFRNLFMKLLST